MATASSALPDWQKPEKKNLRGKDEIEYRKAKKIGTQKNGICCEEN
jgi:hypothetical protein